MKSAGMVPDAFVDLKSSKPGLLVQVLPEDLNLLFGQLDLAAVVINDDYFVVLNGDLGAALALAAKIELLHFRPPR